MIRSFRRSRIYRVARRNRRYYVRAFDAAAICTIASQMAIPVDSVERAPGHSKEAISMRDFQLMENKARYSRKRKA